MKETKANRWNLIYAVLLFAIFTGCQYKQDKESIVKEENNFDTVGIAKEEMDIIIAVTEERAEHDLAQDIDITSVEIPLLLPEPIEMEQYSGPLYHVFYHFLIAFPEIAYQTSYGDALDKVCVTPTEFWKSLEELYKNNYVLMDINKYITINQDGSVSAAKIMVPKGKKPLIMSFDDINYYSINHGKGICDKIILDENGEFAMYTKQKDGTELITYDNGIVPLLERFCKLYPDFSPFGDKGLLALTGFDGILGYRTQWHNPEYQAEIEAVKPVVKALKESGWKFASHSYGHIHTKKADVSKVKTDTEHWEREVASILGDTRVYIFPYGEYDNGNQEKLKVLKNQGFQIFCGVGLPPYSKYYEDYFFMDRQFIDGTSLRNYGKLLSPLMDSKIVYCTAERPE